jgi:TRAP transporter TAXI family solute receptor
MTGLTMFGRRKLLSVVPAVALAPARAQAQQAKLTLGTAGEGGGFVPYGAALLDLLKAIDPVMEVRTVPTRGTGDNVPKLEAGDIDLGLVSGEVAHELFAGLRRPVTKLTVISVMYSTPGMFVVRADSRYHRIMDLKGRPVVWNGRGTGFAIQAHYVMDGLDLDIDKDFEPIYIERLTDGPLMVIDGRAAALWGGGLRWPGFIEIANNPRGARFIAPTAEEIERIRTKYEFMKQLTVPAGLYPHQYDPIETVGTWSFILARPGLDEAIGRRLAAALHKAERTGILPKQLAQTTVKNTLAAIPRPEVLHAGVAKYYREAGLLK